MPKARTIKTSKKKKLTGKGFKDVAKKVAKVAIPIALAVAGAVAAKQVAISTGRKVQEMRSVYEARRAFEEEKYENDRYARRLQQRVDVNIPDTNYLHEAVAWPED